MTTFIGNTFKGEVGKVKKSANTKPSKGSRDAVLSVSADGRGSKAQGTCLLPCPLNCQGEFHSAECEGKWQSVAMALPAESASLPS